MIRPASEKDLPEVSEIYERIHTAEEEGRMCVGWARSVYPTLQTARDALQRQDLFVLESGGRIAAAAIINQLQGDAYADCCWRYPAQPSEVMVLHTLED